MLHHVIHQGRRRDEKPKVNLNQTSRCGVGRVSGRQIPFLVGNTLESKLTHGTNLNLDETDSRTVVVIELSYLS